MGRLSGTQIFATGVFLCPMLVNGKWMWIADEFEDDSFYNGDCIDPQVIADNEKDLIKQWEDD